MCKTSRLAAVAVVAALGPWASAAEPNQPATTQPVDMTASDVGVTLTRMLLDKPGVPVTRPTDIFEPNAVRDVPLAGSMVIGRLCRLRRDEKAGWFVLEFEPEPGRPDELPRRALPCRLLEQMEPLAAQSADVRFRVSGETTVHREHGYLLLTIARILPTPAKPAPPAPSEGPTPLVPAAAPPIEPNAPAETPTSQPADDANEPSSEDILHQLLNRRPGRTIGPTAVPAALAPAPSVAPGAGKPLVAGTGAMVVDRLVRILPELTGPWWEARFEADNTLQEPPMRLLPCGFFHRAQQAHSVAGPGAQPVLRISGLVTHYKGGRYLLIRKLLPERRLGRF